MTSATMTRPVVLIDADNVLYQWEQAYIEARLAINPNDPHVIPYGERTGFEILDVNGEQEEITLKIKTRPGFYFDLTPYDGAKEALEEMEAAGFDVFICTAPSLSNPTCASDKHAAITRDFGRKWADRTIITKDKTLVRGDVLIDDKPEVTGVMEPTWQHVLFHQSYNQHVDKVRIKHWGEWETKLGFLLEKTDVG